MNNNPALMNSISDFFNDKSKWEWTNLNILLFNKNFESENCNDSEFFNTNFLNFKFIDTDFSMDFIKMVSSFNDKESKIIRQNSFNYDFNNYNIRDNMLMNYSPNGSTVYYSTFPESYLTYSNSWDLPINYNPFKFIDYKIIKNGFNNFLKRIFGGDFELEIKDSFCGMTERSLINVKSENGFTYHYSLDNEITEQLDYTAFADSIISHGFDFISLFYMYSNFISNSRRNILVRSEDTCPFLKGLDDALRFENSMPIENKVLLALKKDKESNFLLKGLENFTYRINNKNEIVKYKLKDKVNN